MSRHLYGIRIAVLLITIPCSALAQQSDPVLSPTEKAAAVATWDKLTAEQRSFLIKSYYAKKKSPLPATKSAVAIVNKAPGNAAPAATAAVETSKCQDQRLFLRRDRSDVFSFLVPCGPSDEPGASGSLTRDSLAGTTKITPQGLLGYVVARDKDSLYAFAPSIYANGTFADPFKAATERSAVRGSFDSQFVVPNVGGVDNYIDIAPYAQTDFRGIGRIAGVDAIWEPYYDPLHLGGRDDENYRELIGFYWRLEPELDILHVETPGLTNFTSRSNYEFLGGTAQARLVLFQNMPEVGPLCGRIYVNGTGQYFDNASTGSGLWNYSAEVGYFLGSGVAPYWRYCVPPDANGHAPQPSSSATSSSISFVYSNGTDKMTLVNQKQYKVQLNFR